MKKWSLLLFCLSFQLWANEVPQEATWKIKARNIITSFAGEGWANKILGPRPEAPKPEIKLPEIPKNFKKSTDVASYTKKSKELTEFERLPKERQRQFDYNFLTELFQVVRKSEAKEEEIATWLNTLDQGGSREGVYQGLVLDEAYGALENREEKSAERLLDFGLRFSEKFLAQTFKKENLSGLNLFSIKRILTEKALDVLEYYEVNNLDHLNQWYAIFSSELATEYAPLLKTQLRKDSRFEYHLEWAKKMPVQHIKSEFIIKFHTVMNGLQMLDNNQQAP